MKTLYRNTFATLACTLTLLGAPALHAANIEVAWEDPATFRDIRATETPQKVFEREVMQELENQFRANARALADGQTLHISMQDLDLAGEVEFSDRTYPGGLRVVRDIHFPTLTFSYELRDADGNVVKAGNEELRDLGFRNMKSVQRDHTAFRYEKALIDNWFKEQIVNDRTDS